MKLGVPTICRYDLLQRLISSAERGSVRPDEYVIVDNGGRARSSLRLPKNVTVIEPGKNLGVAASWNVLLDFAGDEAIVISNDDVTLGKTAFAELCAAAAAHPLVTASGWSLFAQSPSCTSSLGFYDETFYPAYYEDADYSYRARLARFPRHAARIDFQHAISSTIRVRPDLNSSRSAAYYQIKWGGDPGRERFTVPFGGDVPSGWALRGSTWLLPPPRSIIDHIYQR